MFVHEIERDNSVTAQCLISDDLSSTILSASRYGVDLASSDIIVKVASHYGGTSNSRYRSPTSSNPRNRSPKPTSRLLFNLAKQ